MPTRVRRVTSRILPLPGGLQRHITYWLCHESSPSGNAGTYFIRCHLVDRSGERVLREAVALSGNLGANERVTLLAFDLLTRASTPVGPENLRYLSQDLLSRVAAEPSATYNELLSAVKSRAAALLEKLQRADGSSPLHSEP